MPAALARRTARAWACCEAAGDGRSHAVLSIFFVFFLDSSAVTAYIDVSSGDRWGGTWSFLLDNRRCCAFWDNGWVVRYRSDICEKLRTAEAVAVRRFRAGREADGFSHPQPLLFDIVYKGRDARAAPDLLVFLCAVVFWFDERG